MLVGIAQAQTTLITPTIRAFSSEYPPGRMAISVVNGSGLSGPGLATDTHGNDAPNMWLTKGPGDGGDDYNPSITLDLGEVVNLATTRIWAYNEPGFTGTLGAQNIEVLVSSDDVNYNSLGLIVLREGTGSATEAAQDFATASAGVRYVRLNILSNFDGQTFPDNVVRGLTGFSEVRFEAQGVLALKPIITQQPQSQTIILNAPATFTVIADDNGAPPLSYQWRKNGAALSDGGIIYGATTATLFLAGITAADQGNYDVVVTSPNGSTPSSPASLTLLANPTGNALITPVLRAVSSEIAPARAAISLVDGSGLSGPGLISDTHSADASQMWLSKGPGHGGTDINPSITFDLGGVMDLVTTRIWNYNEPGWTERLGAQNIEVLASSDDVTYHSIGAFTLAQAFAAPGDAAQDFATPSTGVRYVRINILSKFNGETYPDSVDIGTVGLSEVRFEANPLTLGPTVARQPQNQTSVLGGSATFAVIANANGKPPLSYQWRKNETALSDGGSVSGATTATLTLSNITADDHGNYDVVVTTPNGTTSSLSASLTVIPAPTASITLHAGILVEGIVGMHYRVEYREALDQADDWKLLQDIPSLPSTPFRVYDPAPATSPQRYYRSIIVL